MKPTLVDSDIVSYFIKNDGDVYDKFIAYIQEYGALNISIVTYYEVLRGLYHKNATRQIRDFEGLLSNCKIIDLTVESTQISATEYQEIC